MRNLLAKVELVAREHQSRCIADVVALWSEQAEDAKVTPEGSRVIVEGRAMLRRWLTSSALRTLWSGRR